MGKLRREDGFALPTTVILLAIVLLVAGVTTVVAIASLSDARRDRSSTQAFEAADAGIDTVHWHMNRHLTSSDVQELFGYADGVLQTAGCLSVEGDLVVGEVLSANTESGFCAEISLDGFATEDPVLCSTQLRFDLAGPLPDGLITRDIVCSATSGNATRRIRARVGLQVTSGSPATLWVRQGWVECSSEPPSGSTLPTAGCPDPT